MSALIDKLRKSRQTDITSGGYVFTVRRPTELEWFEMRGTKIDTRRLLAYVDGWSGVKEADIINGGDPHPVEFDQALFVAWVEDKPDIMGDVVKAIMASRVEQAEKVEASAKN